MALFERNIKNALNWLFEIQDMDNFGWSWIRDISPNAQNTAEVVSVCIKFEEYLTDNQKALVSEAVGNWLLEPSVNGAIVIDYVWIMYALVQFAESYELFKPEFSKEQVCIAATECMDLTLEQQNEDGGWADDYGDYSTTVRTALVLYCAQSYILRFGSTTQINQALDRGMEWLLQRQNEDGGWGNKAVSTVLQEFGNRAGEFSHKTLADQYLSQAVATGYALMAIGRRSPHICHSEIERGISYLKSCQQDNGSFELYYEVGIRKDVQFTFRHFGTVWALKGLFCGDMFDFQDTSIARAVYYLLGLQDEVSGGWKCSPESDVYTWSTSNALSILARLREFGDTSFDLNRQRAINELLENYIYAGRRAENEDGSLQKNDNEQKPEGEPQVPSPGEMKRVRPFALARIAIEMIAMAVVAFWFPPIVMVLGILLALELWQILSEQFGVRKIMDKYEKDKNQKKG